MWMAEVLVMEVRERARGWLELGCRVGAGQVRNLVLVTVGLLDHPFLLDQPFLLDHQFLLDQPSYGVLTVGFLLKVRRGEKERANRLHHLAVEGGRSHAAAGAANQLP